MAEERIGSSDGDVRTYWSWTELFRTFQVALDPKKLVLAAAGIVATWAGWWLLAIIFFSARSQPVRSDFDDLKLQDKYHLTAEQAKQRGDDEYRAALDRYILLTRLAGKGSEDPKAEPWKRATGEFRVAPWHENRGPNPYKLVTDPAERERSWEKGHFFDWVLRQQGPVLIEPLVKFLKPVLLLLTPQADGWNRIYLLLVTLWTLAVWALFGGAITRLAAVQLAGKDRPGLMEAVRFVAARYLSYLAAPLVPLGFVAVLVILSVIYGFIHLIPIVGDLTDSVLWPFLVLLGFAQAVLLIGLVGYPLMYSTISTEGSDTFDALSRSYNYVYQSPWNYLWYSLVAVLYGAVLVFFVGFVGSLVVYLTKWSVAQVPLQNEFTSRRVDNLFLWAPESFGWRDLLVNEPALEAGAEPAVRNAYLEQNFYAWNYVSAFFVSLWMTLIFLLVIGFGYSYYFSAFSMIYLLMRRKVDDTELDEVYLEEDEPAEPLLPPSPAPAPGGATPLQMVEPPVLRTPEPPKPPASPPPAPEPKVETAKADTPSNGEKPAGA